MNNNMLSRQMVVLWRARRESNPRPTGSESIDLAYLLVFV